MWKFLIFVFAISSAHGASVSSCSDIIPMPRNARGVCQVQPKQECDLTCIEGTKFPNGKTTAKINCKNGEWRMEPNYERCEPTCENPCLNGGTCVGVNQCQCVGNFRGDQCQYNAITQCAVDKLKFNGSYKCSGSYNEMKCTVGCPEPFDFFNPSANKVFTCKYSEGFFTPAIVPQCDYKGHEVLIKRS